MELRKEQKNFIAYATKQMKSEKYCVCEMPTAFGKSFSALMLAKKLIDEKTASKVIIATSDNSLAKSIFLEAGAIKDLPSYVLGIGKSNYLDYDKLIDFMETELKKEILPVTHKVVESTIKELTKDYPYVLMEDFLNKLDVVDAGKREFLSSNLSLEKSNAESFKEYKIQ